MAILSNPQITGSVTLSDRLNVKGKSFTYDELVQAIEFRKNLLNFLQNETDINIEKFYEYEEANNILEKLKDINI